MRQCTTCGREIEDSHPFVVCPKCLLSEALCTELSVSGERGGPAPSHSPRPVVERPGDAIGPYRLLKQIGEGGCGIVYLAEQTEPIRRRVALKVIKTGMDTKEVIARFEAERQALALMDHPNIAKVLDGGATATGRPYFVMEWVHGIKITEYCDENRLPPGERLALFTQVCRAIQHAHQKGVIHRDIKPSNILVALQDDRIASKIIDFGIAKATGQRLTERTLVTTVAQVIGTPAYMSPEQARLTGHDIDTRSDVYSLGVLLYELLSGQTPFDTQRLCEAGLDEIRRIIREEDPPRPSARLSTLDAARRTSVASQRHLDLPQLISLVRGDLDWIVMKCLEKDRARRYESASALAEDVERYLRHEPVSAAAPGALYRMRKLVRRHRAGVCVAAALILLLVSGIVASTWQAVRATRAERELSETLSIAKEAADLAREQADLARESQKNAQKQAELAESEKANAEKQKVVADSAKEEAERQRESAVGALKKAEAEKTAADEARSWASNEWLRAETALREAKSQRKKLEETLDYLLFDLSEALLPVGRVDLLRSVTRQVREHYESLPEDDKSIESLSRRFKAFENLGQVLAVQGQSQESLDSQLKSLSLAEELAELTSENERNGWQGKIAVCHRRLGEFWQSRGDSGRALQEYQKSLEKAQPLAEADPDNLEWQRVLYETFVQMGEAHKMLGETTRALAAHGRGMRIARRAGEGAPQDDTWLRYVGNSYGNIALLLVNEDQLDRAYDSCRQGLEIAQELAARHPENPQMQEELAGAHETSGDVLLAQRETDQAFEQYQEALQLRQRLVQAAPDNTDRQRALLHSTVKIGRVLVLQTRKPRRWTAFLEGFKLLAEIHRKNTEILRNLAVPEDVRQQPLALYRESVNLARQLSEKDPANLLWLDELAQSHSLLADLLTQKKEREAALEGYRAALRVRKQVTQAGATATVLEYRLALSHANVAAALQHLSHKTEAEAEAREAFRILVGLTSRWPGNFGFLYAPRLDEDNLSGQVSMISEQRDALGAVVKRGYEAVEKQAKREAADTSVQEDLAAYHEEMAIYSLLFEDKYQSLKHVEEAVAVRRWLLDAAPANPAYVQQAVSSCVLSAVLQLIRGEQLSAKNSAGRGLEMAPDSVALKAVLVLADVLAGEFQEVRRVIDEVGDREVHSGETFAEATLNDARRLHSKGLGGVNLAAIEAALRAEPDPGLP